MATVIRRYYRKEETVNSLGSGYRLFVWPWWRHWFSPHTYYYWMKYKVQRAQRGWADCDVWSLDNYLAEWLPGALRHLKDTKHGVPMAMFDTAPEDIDETGNPTETAMDKAVAKWDVTLGNIIEGFEAWNRMSDGLYEKELGEYPLPAIDDCNKPDPSWADTIK